MMQDLTSAKRRETVSDYLTQFPDTPTLTLAKLIYHKHKSSFSSVEAARSAIRYQRGQIGDTARQRVANSPHLKPPGDRDPFDKIPDGLTSLECIQPIPIDAEKTLRLCDVHVPYHDRPALVTALKWGKRENVDAIIVDDFIDFFALSFWEKDPDQRDFANELKTLKLLLEIIRDQFPDARFILKQGNHEARYERYMRVKAPELLGVPAFKLKNLIEADKYNLEVMPDQAVITIGNLKVIHGHEFRTSFFSPVNPARGLWLRAKSHCICGHYHRTSSHTEKTIDDKVYGCWSVGCLCELKPDYMPLNNWNHGAAIIYRTGDDDFVVSNKRIVRGDLY